MRFPRERLSGASVLPPKWTFQLLSWSSHCSSRQRYSSAGVHCPILQMLEGHLFSRQLSSTQRLKSNEMHLSECPIKDPTRELHPVINKHPRLWLPQESVSRLDTRRWISEILFCSNKTVPLLLNLFAFFIHSTLELEMSFRSTSTEGHTSDGASIRLSVLVWNSPRNQRKLIDQTCVTQFTWSETKDGQILVIS